MELNVNKNGTATAADQLSEIVSKAEELLGKISDSGEASAGDLRQRVQATMQKAKGRLTQLQTQTRDSVNQGMKSTDDYVRANPWTAVAVAAGIGAFVGALVARRI